MATHGSLTKAGKVRGQTPKVEGRKIVGDSSSVANKSNFNKQFALGRYPGQNKPGQRRKRR
jgi:small subunit ribosomal protein S30e